MSKFGYILGAVAVMAQMAGAAQPLERPVTRNVPALDAQAIKTNRAETVRLFRERMFGFRPVERPADLRFATAPDRPIFGGRGVHRKVTISATGPRAPFSFTANAYLPKGAKSVRSFIYIYLGQRVKSENFRADAERPGAWSLPIEAILARGYAVVSFNNWDVAMDDKATCFSTGVFKAWGPSAAERTATSWSAIDAWAWAASRVLDWIETQPDFDSGRVAVVGHSRGGKTSLWAAVADPRFALACVNDSGCSGAKLNHAELPESESLERINAVLPHWFCLNYHAYANREFEMPFDQHQLVACLAPRAVAVHSATKDAWAGPAGEFLTCALATPAWEVYGVKGLVASGMPVAEAPLHGGRVGYYLREGKHDLEIRDWTQYLDFADRVLR